MAHKFLSWHIDLKKICHDLAYCTSHRLYVHRGLISGKEKLVFSEKIYTIVILPTTKYSWNTLGLNLGLNGKKPELWYILARVQ